jgi:glycosyltransferase involved in cell wall biosynthesis
VVAENLTQNHRVDPRKIFFLNYFVRLEAGQTVPKAISRQDFFGKFHIPASRRFYVAGMGTATHRKGIDIFVETCRQVTGEKKDICFVWIGDFEEDSTRTKITGMIKEYALEGNFTMTGRIPNASSNLLPFDLFLLTSREDPYPMVILEAAAIKLPAVCFEKSGGAAEFMEGGCGWTVPGFSAREMADKVLELQADPAGLVERGMNAYHKATAMHTNEELIKDQFGEIVKNVKNQNG